MIKNNKVNQMAKTAMLTAVTCTATLAVQIPLPGGGYVHLGDAAVLLSGWLLGPLYGAFAAGVGSMLADMFSGYLIYAPATLFIKAASAALCAVCLRSITPANLVISGLIGGIVVPVGYFLYEAVLLGVNVAFLNGISIALKESVCLIFAVVFRLVLQRAGID